MTTASVIPHVNQVEFHPFQNPVELRKFCKDHKIQIEVKHSYILYSFLCSEFIKVIIII